MGKVRNALERCQISLKSNLLPRAKAYEKDSRDNKVPRFREIKALQSGITHLPHDYCRMILSLLPLPLLSIDKDLKIIFMNRKIKDILPQTMTPEEDKILFEYFPDSITGRINVANKTGTPRRIKRTFLWGAFYDVIFVPLPGNYEIEGGFILLNPSK